MLNQFLRKIISSATVLLALFCGPTLRAQDPLPRLSVRNINGKVIVSWQNQYKKKATVINIQRSFDSLRNYSTIGSVLNPENTDNGYVDNKPPYKNMYYRVFVAFEGGTYTFSEVKRPGKMLTNADLTGADSAALRVPKPPPPPPPKPVNYIFIGKENNVIIKLPDVNTKKYTISFFDEKQQPLFELNKLHEAEIILDKVNFLRSGWYYFEVYEKGKLVQKDKFFLPKDDKPSSLNERGRTINR